MKHLIKFMAIFIVLESGVIVNTDHIIKISMNYIELSHGKRGCGVTDAEIQRILKTNEIAQTVRIR